MKPQTLSVKARRTKSQPISWLMRQAIRNPDIISLAAGLVDSRTLPADATGRAVAGIMKRPKRAERALQYGTTEGLLDLRKAVIRRYLQGSEGSPSPDDVVITSGSQQFLYLVTEMLVNPGDIVLLGAPSYFVYMGTLDAHGARTVGIPLDRYGMSMSALEKELLRIRDKDLLHRLKLIYTVSYFQNPSGVSLALTRRRRLLRLARRFSTPGHPLYILEDAAYRELRYHGPDVPPVKLFDTENRHVIMTGTFSKPYAPGLKTGFGVLPRPLVKPLLNLKGNHDFGNSNMNQHIILDLLQTGAFDRHVRTLRKAYRRKCGVMLRALKKHMTGVAGWIKPLGGLYVWVTLPAGTATGPDSALFRRALDEGVLYVPGSYCFPGAPSSADNHLRLSFGIQDADAIEEGVRRLARAMQETAR